MLDDYMKDINQVTSPESYNVNNYKLKIEQRETRQKQVQKEEENYDIAGRKQGAQAAKMKIKIPQGMQKDVKNKVSTKPGQKTAPRKTEERRVVKKEEMQRVSVMSESQELQYKSMNYRHEIEVGKNRIAELEKILENKNQEISKLLREKEHMSSYLIKLESVMRRKTDTNTQGTTETFKDAPTIENTKDNAEEGDKFEAFNAHNLTINITGASPTITMIDGEGHKNVITRKRDMMKFLNKIYRENQSLKNFQNQVFMLSKTYDDINNNLAESISGFQEISKNIGSDNIKIEVDNKLHELKTQIQNSLETKQSEYNMLLEKKDEDYHMLQEEFLNVSKEIEQRRMERIFEQKTIMDLNMRLEMLESKLKIYEKDEEPKDKAYK